jgi:flavin reductase (DIM6/NTAB) family NADH-FMN oxidoreductase RutF
MSDSNEPGHKLVTVDFAAVSGGVRYKLMAGAIVPRPIAFVSTISAAGVGNLAPFSFFNGVSSEPPCLVFSVTRKSNGDKKDTLRNIEETGSFVVNTVSEWMAGPMNETSADYPYGVDEMLKVGLTPLPSLKVKAFRVKEAAIQMECALEKVVEIGEGAGSSSLVVGRILLMHAREDIYNEGKIDAAALRPVARLGGPHYGKLGELFELPRPKMPDNA